LLAAQGDDAGARRLQERAERAASAQLKQANEERSHV
jgi:hypothetical protein